MKSVVSVGVALLCLVPVIYSQSLCSTPTAAESQCFQEKFIAANMTVMTACKGVDFSTLIKGDVIGSNVCQVPECITAIGDNVYTPCKRTDMTFCLASYCFATCYNYTNITTSEMQCMIAAGTKSQQDIGTDCPGVDFQLLNQSKIKESKICEHLDCITTLDKDMYTPCKRSDISPCVRLICNIACAAPTPKEMQCMTDAGSKTGTDVQTRCKGVDLQLLAKKEIKQSKICDHPECIEALTADIYFPCDRSDLGLCLYSACNSSCSDISPDEIKCMTDAATKNTAELKVPCNGVDFQALENKDIMGSKICDHPECITALNQYVYTPCKRSDVTTCIRSQCPH